MNIIIYNHKTRKGFCPECKSSKHKFDEEKKETYCTNCGLVLKDTRVISPTMEKYYYHQRMLLNIHDFNETKVIHFTNLLNHKHHTIKTKVTH